MFSGSVVHFGVVLVATVVLSLLVSAVSYTEVDVVKRGSFGGLPHLGRGAQAGHQDGVAGIGAACPGGAGEHGARGQCEGGRQRSRA